LVIDSRFHAGATHLVHGGARGADRDTRVKSSLPCRGLTEAGRQDTAHEHLVDIARVNAAVGDCACNRGGAKVRRGGWRKYALEGSDRCSLCRNDDNWI